MKAKIVAIFPSDESPRYVFGLTAAHDYVVFSPMAGEPDFPFELDDLIKLEQISKNPAEALNLTRNQTAMVRIHDVAVNKDIIRVRYDPQFP